MRTGRRPLKYANACGACAVSRHGCTPAYPALGTGVLSRRGVVRPDLRNDTALEQIHWATNRQGRMGGDWSTMRVFAFDHRMQLEEMAGYTPAKGGAFKELCLEPRRCGCRTGGRAMASCATTASGKGAACGEGTGLLDRAAPANGRARDPLELEQELGADCGGLEAWAREDVVKVLCFCHPMTMPDARGTGRRRSGGFRGVAPERAGIPAGGDPSKVGPVDDMTTAHADRTVLRHRRLSRLVEAGADGDGGGVENAIAAIEAHDRHTRGIVVLGLDAPGASWRPVSRWRRHSRWCAGFAVGRTIFGGGAGLAGRADRRRGCGRAMARRYAPALRGSGTGAGGARCGDGGVQAGGAAPSGWGRIPGYLDMKEGFGSGDENAGRSG